MYCQLVLIVNYGPFCAKILRALFKYETLYGAVHITQTKIPSGQVTSIRRLSSLLLKNVEQSVIYKECRIITCGLSSLYLTSKRNALYLVFSDSTLFPCCDVEVFLSECRKCK